MTPITPRSVLRHGIAILLLFCGWWFLSQWYQYQGRKDYLIACALFAPGILLAVVPFVLRTLKNVAAARLLIVLGLLLVALPWGEWLRLKLVSLRADWTEQIFFQCLFLYFSVLVLSSFPVISRIISTGFYKGIDFLSSKSRLLWLPPVLFFVFTTWIALCVFRQTPILFDSAAHLFQARIFSHWRLAAPAPPVSDFFSAFGDMLVIYQGQWFSMYQPGFAMLLSLATPFHAEWLVSPLLGACTISIWLAYAVRWHGRAVASLLGWLCLFSPFLFVMSSTVMVHTPELLIVSAAIYLCRSCTEKHSLLQDLTLFLVLCFGMIVRSFSILVFLAPILVYTGWTQLRSRSLFPALVMAAGIGAGTLLLMCFQWKTTGDPFRPAYLLEFPDPGFGFGFHPGSQHTPVDALENLSNTLLALNEWVTGWYSGSLIFLVAFFLFERQIQKWDRLLLLCCAALALFYFFYSFDELFLGPRYYYLTAPVLLFLISRSVLLRSRFSRLVPLFVISWISFFPAKLSGYIQRYNASLYDVGQIKEQVHKSENQRTLIFLGQNISQNHVDLNDPFLKAPVILCRDLGDRNPEAVAAFPNYKPLFLSTHMTVRGTNFKRTFELRDRPEKEEEGISFLQLAMALQSANSYRERDCFDVFYVEVMKSEPAAILLAAVEKKNASTTGKNLYQQNFHLGLIHAARMLLLPKLAYEEKGVAWVSVLNPGVFRQEYNSAVSLFKMSGAIGSGISTQLEKVGKRIDQDRDGNLSNEEIVRYSSEKIEIIRAGGTL